jgi:hypothetical protein
MEKMIMKGKLSSDTKMHKKVLFVLIIALFGFMASSCLEEPGDVETWDFTYSTGYITGAYTGQFDSYVSKYLTETEWDNISTYRRADGNYSGSWSTLETYLNSLFSTTRVSQHKSRLSSYGKLTYFYLNTSNQYRWIRIDKD